MSHNIWRKQIYFIILNSEHGGAVGQNNCTANLFIDSSPITRVKSSKFVDIIMVKTMNAFGNKIINR